MFDNFLQFRNGESLIAIVYMRNILAGIAFLAAGVINTLADVITRTHAGVITDVNVLNTTTVDQNIHIFILGTTSLLEESMKCHDITMHNCLMPATPVLIRDSEMINLSLWN